MTFNVRHAVASVGLATALAVGAVACASPATTTKAPVAAQPKTQSQVAASQGTTSGPAVTMTDIAFAPKELKVKAGTTVVWKNTSQTPHTVTSDTGLFDSGQAATDWLLPGKEFSFKFDKPGTYTYNCFPHKAAGMTGTIVVE